MPVRQPAPLPPDLLSGLAIHSGLLLCLDYDGTLAEIAAEPELARPWEESRRQLERLSASPGKIAVAIVTGRTLSDVKSLLGIESGLFFSGVHGLELDAPGEKPSFISAALECAPDLAAVRRWLADNVPDARGFRIEDKQVAVGLHYRGADANEAARLCERFAEFVALHAPRLKLVRLKMLAEAMPRAASKAHAVLALKEHVPESYVTAYFGDDTTDEDAFGALGQSDLGVLVGPPRESRARYQVDGPAQVARELRVLASLSE
jgi:trehalose 6-phosphate phosphatase